MNGRPGEVDVSPTAAESHDGEISLSVYFETLWRYRSVIVAAIALVTVLFAIGVLVYRVRTPTERITFHLSGFACNHSNTSPTGGNRIDRKRRVVLE